MIFPFQENLLQLWRESRGNLIGGVLAVIIITLAALFWKSLVAAIKRFFKIPTAPPLPLSPPAQEIRLKVETVQPAAELPKATCAVSRSPIPRPPITGFVARRDDSGRDIVERLKEELAPAKEQLIVLWGAGGVGKTTLAAETARAMRAIFEGGIIWTSADGKPDFSLSTLLDDIATHLGRPELRQLAPAAKDNEVHDAVSKARDTLIVLDNFETVSPEDQEKCAGWLANRASCPALITSRDEVRHARPVHILAMSESEANEFLVRLISDAHNKHAFEQLDHKQIIRAADRTPLVLQWIVKRIDSAKQPQAVLDELSHGEGDAAERVFDRSFDLAQVGDDGRAVLLALSLFVPDASRSALANVAGFDKDEKRLEAALQQLIELWLIQTSENNSRIRIEGLTRELAKARLSKDISARNYRQRFVSYFLEYTQNHETPTSEDYEALETEKDNLLNAMDTAFELADWESVKSFAYIVGLPVNGMLSVRGYWAEALKANQQALEAARQSKSQPDIADFAHNLAIVYGNRGELSEARQLYNESLEIARSLGQENNIAITLHQLALLAHDQGELVEARRLYNESLEISRTLDNQRGIADTFHQLGLLAQTEGNLVEARKLYNESLEITKSLGNPSSIAQTLHQLATLALLQGDFEEARKLYDQSLEIAKNIGNQIGTAAILHQLGMLTRNQGELAEARHLFHESLKIKRRLGDQHGIALTLSMLGNLAKDENDPKEATRLFAEALIIFERLESPIANTVRLNLEEARGKVKDKRST